MNQQWREEKDMIDWSVSILYWLYFIYAFRDFKQMCAASEVITESSKLKFLATVYSSPSRSNVLLSCTVVVSCLLGAKKGPIMGKKCPVFHF